MAHFLCCHLDLLVYKPLVLFPDSSQKKRVGLFGYTLFHASDHVRTAKLVGLTEIGRRPVRGMIGMGVVKTHDVQVASASLPLDAD